MYGGISKSCVKFDIDRLIAIGLNHCPTHCKSDLRKEIKMGLINMVSSSLTVLFSSIGCDDNFKKTMENDDHMFLLFHETILWKLMSCALLLKLFISLGRRGTIILIFTYGK